MADRYVVQDEIASGGMGVVTRVLDRLSGEERALKRIKPSVRERPFFGKAFEREYQVLAGLDHPRIIRVFDYGIDELGPYYTMELLAGDDMRKLAPLPYREACFYLRDVATSLALLHARRMIHRDLSPGNVRRTPDGHCKLFDFGALAWFGQTREIVGTPPAVPPEAVAGGALDQRADLYQLGALAYWMLTGQHAYPASCIDELPQVWQEPPLPPSEIVAGIPEELDALVLALLSAQPLARPGSAAEVMVRLEVIGDLAPLAEGEAEELARSFLLNPRFMGRSDELRELEQHSAAALRGEGCAVLIEASAGMGRTRLLEELGVRAQIAGAVVLRVDASMFRYHRGTLRALALRALDAFPALAADASDPHRSALAGLGREVAERLLSQSGSVPPVQTQPGPPDRSDGLEHWFADISRHKALVVQIDNVEYADDASLGVVAALARASRELPLLLVVTQRSEPKDTPRVGLATLRNHCRRIALSGLKAKETLELARSLFGDADNVARFSEWLHGRTAGSPLHCIEISRQLLARQVIRHVAGTWVLPVDRPDAKLPAALEDALAARLSLLSEPARALAEGLSLQREQASLELCRLLIAHPQSDMLPDDRMVLGLLDELARNDVLHSEDGGYRFSSDALREALLHDMDDARTRQTHARLGEAFAALAGHDDAALRITAGWHLIRGGDELRGADMIAGVAANSATVRTVIANLYRAGEPLEAALKVYKRHRRSIFERAPLLATLSHAGYYEDRVWGERYGDEALDTLEHVTGLRLARRLSGVLGRYLGLIVAMFIAFVRFQLVPKRERNYSFLELLVQLFGAVTTLTGIAGLTLDVERAGKVADVLEPFSVLPDRTTPVGIYQFCRSLQELGREYPARAFASFDTIVKRFADPRYYPTLPSDVRPLYIAGAHFARGVFASFRNDGRAALESADALDASGLKLYAMIASALRYHYYTNRGEAPKAAVHREQVELHAAHVGSAWQVELWSAPANMLVACMLNDVVMMTRVHEELLESSKSTPSLALYSRLAGAALSFVRQEPPEHTHALLRPVFEGQGARSFIGWAAVRGFEARSFNQNGLHERARESCAETLAHLTDEDLEYVTLFLNVTIQMAIAQGALGEVSAALQRIDGLLAHFQDSNHPLVLGSLHEARARIAWSAGLHLEYATSLSQTQRWYQATGTPALIAACDRLIQLSATPKGREGRGGRESSSARTGRSSEERSEEPTSEKDTTSERDASSDQTVALTRSARREA